ncbi:hypothetical protein JOB18_037512 [Solea senegalensis]|uniref:Secreted protein n=1 Tax=Solea senegalensis TaxID=28829 RepID=A0AAV6SBD5_SOLSE|nr:hypothetical protein JOB18_037512 [Solea senegalensis]
MFLRGGSKVGVFLFLVSELFLVYCNSIRRHIDRLKPECFVLMELLPQTVGAQMFVDCCFHLQSLVFWSDVIELKAQSRSLCLSLLCVFLSLWTHSESGGLHL